MDGILYLLIFACLGLVGVWYVGNEILGARGGWGLFGIRDSEAGDSARADDERRFRVRDRIAPDPARASVAAAAEPAAAEPGARSASRFREKAPRGFRDRDEARYRSRGPLPRFGDKPDRTS